MSDGLSHQAYHSVGAILLTSDEIEVGDLQKVFRIPMKTSPARFLMTGQKRRQLQWEIILPPCNPDLTQNHYFENVVSFNMFGVFVLSWKMEKESALKFVEEIYSFKIF